MTSLKKNTPDYFNLKTVNWTGALFLLLSPVAAVVLTIYHLREDGFMWPIWLLAAVFYTLTACSITGGYHRYFAHRTYQARSWVKWFWAIFGAAAFQNSILIWAREHRAHHRFVDTDLDPYSINKGFFFAHFGWMMTTEQPNINYDTYARDLNQDPIVVFQDKYYIPIAIGVGFVLPTLIGWGLGSALGGLAVAAFLRIALLHHMTFFINSWCHYFGRQTYTDSNTARDSVLMAIATFGEGYHNFHHIFAHDYRNGVRWYHWDPTKWIIRLLNMVGGTFALRRTPWSEIVRMQMQMDEKRLKQRLDQKLLSQFQDQMDRLKTKTEEAVLRFEKLREEYNASARMDSLRLQVKQAKREFRQAFREWRRLNSRLLQGYPG